MVNRWSIVVLLVGMAAGYSISGSPVGAQVDPLPLAAGDRVTFVYDREDQQGCTVAEFQGSWIKCGQPSGGTSIGRQRPETWHNTRFVLRIVKTEF